MQINTNTNASTNSKVNEIFLDVMFHTCSTTAISALHNVFLVSECGWVMLKMRCGVTWS
jgi:hypothetical protein